MHLLCPRQPTGTFLDVLKRSDVRGVFRFNGECGGGLVADMDCCRVYASGGGGEGGVSFRFCVDLICVVCLLFLVIALDLDVYKVCL